MGFTVNPKKLAVSVHAPSGTERGFTLLEVLAVLFIIGIISSFVGLSVGQRSSRAAQDEAERLYGLVRIAGEESVLQGRELAVEFTRQSYRFWELAGDNQWMLIEEDKLFRERKFPPDVNIELLVEGSTASFDDEKKLPRIYILSSGELTDFEISFSLEDEKAYTLRGTINGKLELFQADENDSNA
ncbi:MAG: type II secretion system minor pseudopilin GspH [Gammaproteobacteria bacterium]